MHPQKVRLAVSLLQFDEERQPLRVLSHEGEDSLLRFVDIMYGKVDWQ